MANSNFRLLFWGETISNLGDQFTLIALPWLILKLTGDPLILGLVLALAGIPRAVFMLVGGALTDRFSPRNVMLVSNLVRLINVGLLAAMILTGHVTLWMIYLYALVFGIADAFFMPSQTSIVTRLSPKEDLAQANTYIMGSAQLSQFVGPALVGFLIGLLDKGNHSLTGIGFAMVFDAFTFVVSLLTLRAIKVPMVKVTEMKENIMASIVAGIRYAWSNIGLRYILVLVATINFLVVGPFFIGIPVVANAKLVGGAASYGIIMSMYGVGVLIGFLLVGVLTKVSPVFKSTSVLLITTAFMGVFLALMSAANSTFAYGALSFIMAMISGYVSISFITLIQHQVPERMMGRVMSIIMLCSVGLVPLSEISAGLAVKMSVFYMFLIAGLLFFAVSLSTLFVPEVRNFEEVRSNG